MVFYIFPFPYHRSLQRTLAELREYQVKQDQLNDLQQVFKKARRNPDEQYENNMDFHHAKLLQGMGRFLPYVM